jgi:Txe/YoeB family toxin of Txe-Axe toxin-antitoxin module
MCEEGKAYLLDGDIKTVNESLLKQISRETMKSVHSSRFSSLMHIYTNSQRIDSEEVSIYVIESRAVSILSSSSHQAYVKAAFRCKTCAVRNCRANSHASA